MHPVVKDLALGCLHRWIAVQRGLEAKHDRAPITNYCVHSWSCRMCTELYSYAHRIGRADQLRLSPLAGQIPAKVALPIGGHLCSQCMTESAMLEVLAIGKYNFKEIPEIDYGHVIDHWTEDPKFEASLTSDVREFMRQPRPALDFFCDNENFPLLVQEALELYPQIPADLYPMAFDLPIEVSEVVPTPHGVARIVLEWWGLCYKDDPTVWPAKEHGAPPHIPELAMGGQA